MNWAIALLTWATACALIIAAYRLVRGHSRVLAVLFATGIAVRVLLGAALFFISYYRMPVFQSLQTGDGFWQLAIDARWYFDRAAAAAQAGIRTISATEPSPMYLRMLAVWLRIAGATPLSGVLLNLLCYAAVGAIVAAMRVPHLCAAVTLAALSFNPALLIFGTQVLKDPLCVFVIATTFVAIWCWCQAFDGLSALVPAAVLGAGLAAASIYVMAGVRAYPAAFVLVGVIGAAIVAVASGVDWRSRVTAIGGYGALFVILVAAFIYGAGAYFAYYESALGRAFAGSSSPVRDLDAARASFTRIPGGTSLDEGRFDFGVELGPIDGRTRVARVLRGLMVLTVPISVLQALSLVRFTGGRGLLFITDIDTVAIDLTILVSLVLTMFLARERSVWPLIACVTVFIVLMSTGLAYVVTNFGTLFRLRMMLLPAIALLPVLGAPRRGGALPPWASARD